MNKEVEVNNKRHARISSVQFSRSVMSNSLPPHEPQHARPPCPSPNPGVRPNPCPLSWWCHPTISSSVVPFSSCPQSFPAPGSFPMSQLFASGGQSITRIRIRVFACEWHQPPDSHFISESSFSLFCYSTAPLGRFIVGLVPTLTVHYLLNSLAYASHSFR